MRDEKKNDAIAEIDMSDPANLSRAIDLALASSGGDQGWGEMRTAWVHALAKDSSTLWCAWKDDDHPDGPALMACTGNGEQSKANAEFFASARKIVLGLVSEIDRLQRIARISTVGWATTMVRGEKQRTVVRTKRRAKTRKKR